MTDITPDKTPSLHPHRDRRLAWLGAAALALAASGLAAWRYLPRHATPTAVEIPAAHVGGPVLAPNVAGQFYPGEASALQSEVRRLLDGVPNRGLGRVRAIIVPHAGYMFSAPVAAAAFRQVDPSFRTVFLMGDNHNPAAGHSGASVPDAGAMAIPGAAVPLSPIARELHRRNPDLFPFEPAAHQTHVLEVELPFLHALKGWPPIPDYNIVPMVMGGMTPDRLQQIADALDPFVRTNVLFVASTDLSHYMDDASAKKIDASTVQAIVAMNPAGLPPGSCCGPSSVRTILELARRHGWEPHFIAYRNSGDATGDRSRVVGYAAIVFDDPFRLDDAATRDVLDYAKRVVETRVRTGRAPDPDRALPERHPELREKRGVFVTLTKSGQLRGCIGNLTADYPVCDGIREFALKAALEDTRFSPVTDTELPQLKYSVSVLSQPVPLDAPPEEFPRRLKPRVDGVILFINGRSSTFLPQVWNQLPNPEEFLAHLCQKQGAPPDAWRHPSTRLFTYSALVLGEDH